MTERIPLDDEHWADVKTAPELRAADHDTWLAALPFSRPSEIDVDDEDAPEPDPANPAVMPDPAERKRERMKLSFTQATLREFLDKMTARYLVAWSYGDMPPPYQPAYRENMSLRAGQNLDRAVSALNQKLADAQPDPKATPG
jgi:hypothetical protein